MSKKYKDLSTSVEVTSSRNLEPVQKSKEENLVKKTCKELGITQKELAEKMGVPQGTLNRWASTNDIPKMTALALNLILENNSLKAGAEYIQKGLSIFSTLKPTC